MRRRSSLPEMSYMVMARVSLEGVAGIRKVASRNGFGQHRRTGGATVTGAFAESPGMSVGGSSRAKWTCMLVCVVPRGQARATMPLWSVTGCGSVSQPA